MTFRGSLGCLVLFVTCFGAAEALAQIKPQSSGEPSFNEPEMKRHRGGEYFPNQPHKPEVQFKHRLRRTYRLSR